MCDNNTFIVTR